MWEVDAISERGEVNGGINGLVCSNHNSDPNDTVEIPGTNDTRPRQTCETLNVPDCEDRTIYCTFPPNGISSGKIDTPVPNPRPIGYTGFIDGKRTVANPNLNGYEHPTSKCSLKNLNTLSRYIFFDSSTSTIVIIHSFPTFLYL